MLKRSKAIKFMRMARFLAQEFSKDSSTKVGALLVNSQDCSVLSQGYNGMPRGVDESLPGRNDRPLKYKFYEHAERNAIFNSTRPVLKGSIAITTTVPGLSCVRALISTGVDMVCLPAGKLDDPDWADALALFEETNVKVAYFSDIGSNTPMARKLGKYVAYAQQVPGLLAKDPQASVTLFLDADGYTLLSQGYSGFPRGADDSRHDRYCGAFRDVWVETSVRNAIYNVARRFLKGSTALVTATTCVECARGLASAGVEEVFYTEPSTDMVTRWGESFTAALSLLAELGVKTTELTQEEIDPTRASTESA